MSTSAVIVAVEDGHIGSNLLNSGEPTNKSQCKKCMTDWPCATISKARQVKQA